jgi:hypothetical protein
MNTSRLIIGLILIAVTVAMFVFSGENYSTAGAVGFGVLGIITVAISRKNKTA